MSASDIIAKIPSSYDKGLESGSLFFFPSTVIVHSEKGIDVSSSVSVLQGSDPILLSLRLEFVLHCRESLLRLIQILQLSFQKTDMIHLFLLMILHCLWEIYTPKVFPKSMSSWYVFHLTANYCLTFRSSINTVSFRAISFSLPRVRMSLTIQKCAKHISGL